MNSTAQQKVSHEDLMRFLDGEMTPQERALIEGHLEASSELRREFAIFRTMKEELQDLSFASHDGDSVWSRIRSRITSPVGWVLTVVGFLGWAAYGTWSFVNSPSTIVVKLATGAVVIGMLVLLAQVIWDRYAEFGSDPYRNVHR